MLEETHGNCEAGKHRKVNRFQKKCPMSSFLSMPSVPKLPVLRQAWFAPAPRNGSMGCRVSKHTSLPCCTAPLQ